VRSFYRAGSLGTVARELRKHELDSVGIKEVRWRTGDTAPAGDFTVFYGRGNVNYQLEP
jgi:hypothetical protein